MRSGLELASRGCCGCRRTSASATSTRSRAPAATSSPSGCRTSAPRRPPRPGERVRLSWQREHTFAVLPQEGLSDGGGGANERGACGRSRTRASSRRRCGAGSRAGASSRARAWASPGSASPRSSRRAAERAEAGGGGEQPRTRQEVFAGQPGDTVQFANWPLYIDKAKDASGNRYYPSLKAFTDETGIDVNYEDVIQSNEEFFGKLQPQLAGRGLDRLGHHRHHERPAVQRADRERLGLPARPEPSARTSTRTPRRTPRDPAYDPDNDALDGVAVGVHRASAYNTALRERARSRRWTTSRTRTRSGSRQRRACSRPTCRTS